MAHLAPPTGRDRHRERLLGLVLLLLGTSMALLAISAFTHAKVRPAGPHQVATGAPQPSGIDGSRATTGVGPSDHASAAAAIGHSGGADPAMAPSSVGSASGLAPVIVLQNTGDPELAGSVAASFAAGGWTVTETSTFDGDIQSTAAYYDPEVEGAEAAAKTLQAQFAGIARVRPKFAGLPSGPIVVVLTNDYSQGRTTS